MSRQMMLRYESDRLCYPLRAGVPGRRRIIGPTLAGAALTALVALGGCAGTTSGPLSGPSSSDAVVCLSAMVSAGISGGVVGIPAIALSTPACIGLAAEVLKDLIAQAHVSVTSARRTMGARP